ncbi:MAG: hypothetical protein KZQ89_16985 [Candidatus Thiodiazotropha sp. (ex Lucinoma kastoroae)]|nr:hypothetical protein [Candidatus Thiodiazotropha sp. (ex Lucinoma kastoroae)]
MLKPVFLYDQRSCYARCKSVVDSIAQNGVCLALVMSWLWTKPNDWLPVDKQYFRAISAQRAIQYYHDAMQPAYTYNSGLDNAIASSQRALRNMLRHSTRMYSYPLRRRRCNIETPIVNMATNSEALLLVGGQNQYDTYHHCYVYKPFTHAIAIYKKFDGSYSLFDPNSGEYDVSAITQQLAVSEMLTAINNYYQYAMPIEDYIITYIR